MGYRSALSWHYYCWINDWNGGSNNDPYKPFAKWFCDEFFGPMVANTADYRGMEVGGAKMLTEVLKLIKFNRKKEIFDYICIYIYCRYVISEYLDMVLVWIMHT